MPDAATPDTIYFSIQPTDLPIDSRMELFTEYGPFQPHMLRIRSKVIIPHNSRNTRQTDITAIFAPE